MDATPKKLDTLRWYNSIILKMYISSIFFQLNFFIITVCLSIITHYLFVFGLNPFAFSSLTYTRDVLESAKLKEKESERYKRILAN